MRKKTSSSGLPKDDTPIFGENYGLDGFQFEDDYGEAVEEGGRGLAMPQTSRDVSNLPDGFTDPVASAVDPEFVDTSDANDGMGDISFIFKEGADDEEMLGSADLNKDPLDIEGPVDFQWLEEPEVKLPYEEPWTSVIEGIQESWSQRTDGISRSAHMMDPETARAQQGLPAPKRKRSKQEVLRETLDIVQRAVRKSTAGGRLKPILREAKEALGAKRVEKHAQVLDNIRQEHGLIGKIFIRASAYPNCQTGKWKDHVRKAARQAHYVIACADCQGCSFNHGGRCETFKKEIVDEIPWDDAHEYYSQKLAALGVRMPNTGKPRKDLKKAFASRPEKHEGLDQRPFHDIQSMQDVAADSAAKQAKRQKIKTKLPGTKAQRAKTARTVERLLRAGQITKKEAVDILKSGKHPERWVRMAHKKVQAKARKRKSDRIYQGAVFTDRHASMEEAPRTKQLSQVKRLLRWARQQMSEGLMGDDFDAVLEARFAQGVRKDARAKLTKARSKHEGLAGTLYVIASAYASPQGTTGCEKGALKHRTNAIQFLLRMKRCATCVHKNSKGICRLYKKRLVKSAPVDDPKAHQRQALAEANDDVYSVTSMFENPVEELGVTASELDDIQLDDMPENEELGDIVFGGMWL